MPKPSVVALWHQSGGERDEYRRLLIEHGYLIDGPSEPLPCGWPGPVTEVDEYGSEGLPETQKGNTE